MLKRRISLMSAILAATALCLPPLSSMSVQAQQHLSLDRTVDAQGIAYWTPGRLRNAQPLSSGLIDLGELMEAAEPDGAEATGEAEGHPGNLHAFNVQPDWTNRLFEPGEEPKSLGSTSDIEPKDIGTFGAHFSSSRVFPAGIETFYPYSTIGKLFFTLPNGAPAVCSAAVVSFRLVVTAGQCVHQGFGGQSGFHSNFLFVPAYQQGVAPLLIWDWQRAVVTGEWSNGGGTVPNAADYALIETQDQLVNGVTRRIGEVTGGLGWQTLSLLPNHVHMFGYPTNLDGGEIMHQVTGQSFGPIAPNNAAYGSDMGPGAGGGPFVQNFGELALGHIDGLNPLRNAVVGVSSAFSPPPGFAQAGSIFDSRFVDLFNNACANRPGNC
ncbi:MAG: hypothetical protein ETSY2_09080 [Candidatus Entotheonella gemina]|uniref:Peptidase S1 domain-containing protein n=2 Tax=Candidatus Entotheonella TaxID=93171 RepID=W4MCA8_9BACT|nr:MAG: hypothetical protein ETSY2_09080 [Candidatus Entotheonella gemina]